MFALIDLHSLDGTIPFWGCMGLLLIAGLANRGLGKSLMEILGSFHLAVACLFGLFLISYFGTEAQVEMGLFAATQKYFESWLLTERFGTPFEFVIAVPLPGGQLLMSLLALNLMAGGLVRVGRSLLSAQNKRRKVLLGALMVTHVGVIVLLAAGLVKLHFSETGHVTLYEGESATEFVSFHEWEVVIHDAASETEVEEWIIPESDFADLEADSRTFSAPGLPFELVLEHYAVNARPEVAGGSAPIAADSPTNDGWVLAPKEREPENERNVAGLLAKIRPSGSALTIPAILSGFERHPFTFKAGDKDWAVSLRHRRFSLPGEIKLLDFHRELHPGTGMPRVFRSDVEWTAAGSGAPPENIRIEMNEPLRRDGHALFQTNWGPQNDPNAQHFYSQLEVARNPSDHWPTVAVIIIGLSLSLALGLRLMAYMRQQASRRLREQKP